MDRLIRGEITAVAMEDLNSTLPKKKLMIFVSSTFVDTGLERDILHRKILPDLQKKARQHEIEVVFYDMRFGVKDENTLDHMTWVTCKEAIQQCHEGSDGMFFLSLQADRYGYLALPKHLDKDIILQAHKDNQAFSDWYTLDENHCPQRYELKKLPSLDHEEYWDIDLPHLRDTILNSVPFEKLETIGEELLINHSMTEWETLFALNCDSDRCFWVERVFEHNPLHSLNKTTNSPKIADIFPSSSTLPEPDILNRFKGKMKKHLKQDPQSLPVITPTDYFENNGSCQIYLNNWENVLRGRLNMELHNVIKKVQNWNTQQHGIPVEIIEEIIHHCSMALTKAKNFYGREEVIKMAMEILGLRSAIETKSKSMNVVDDSRYEVRDRRRKCKYSKSTGRSRLLSAIDLAIIGKSGCGKTSLMAKLALSLSSTSTNGRIPTIIRFCGTSKFSLHGLKLIQSICIQLLAAHGKADELQTYLDSLPSQDYKTAVASFHGFIASYPVFLYIDSLDQLDNRDEERSKLSFLRDLRPHQTSRIIVSSLPDEYEKDGKPGKYFYQCARTLKTARVPSLEVGRMKTGEFIVESLLFQRNMQLTKDQWIVIRVAMSDEQTILYINLAMEVISQWRSFDKEVSLRPTVKGLIHQIFGDLELSFGKEFVSIAFAMITFSREGVNDPELQDLLSLHVGVLKEVCQHWEIHCFPMHVWLRLKQVIKNLVTEKENHCIKWYHRQLWETAGERYSEKEIECHQIMGRYFANLYGDDVKHERDISSQPRTLNEFTLNEVPIWVPESIVNSRRAVEGYYHLIKAELKEEAMKEVCSLEFVCCSGLAGDLSNCVRYLGELVRLYGDNAIPQQLDHYYRWMRKNITRIVVDPRRQTRMTAGEEPLNSEVKEVILRLEEKERNELGHTLEPMTLGCDEDFDALELELVGHTGKVGSVAWSHDGSKILSGSHDKTIKIWDGITGQLLNTFEGPSGKVYSVSWNHDSSKILSGSGDGTIRVWDVTTCELLQTMKNGCSPINSVSWNYDCSKIVSASDDGRLRTWDGATGKVLKRFLSLHSDIVSCVSWNHDGSKLLSGSADTTINLWDVLTGELLKTLMGHSKAVTSASWNHDSSRIVSGSVDTKIKIWDGLTGDLINSIEGHCHPVIPVMWNRDGSKILSGSWDGRIKIRHASTGELDSTVAETTNDSLAWNREEDRIISGSQFGQIRVWKGWRKQPSKIRIGSLFKWNPAYSSRIMSGTLDGTIQVWDGQKGELLKSWQAHSEKVSNAAWNHDGTRIASASKDKTIKIWNGDTGKLLMTLKGHSDPVNRVVWNRDSSRIISTSSSNSIVRHERKTTFVLWNGVTGKKLKTVKTKNELGAVMGIFWKPGNRQVLVGYYQGVIEIWDGKNLKQEVQIRICDFVNSLSWNHNGNRIITGSGNKIQIWNLPTESKTQKIKNQESGDSFVATGDVLVNAEWEKTLEGHSDVVRSVFWNHDESKIFSGGDDGTIRIWDGTTGQLIRTEAVVGRISSVRLSKDGDRIAFRCKDNFIRCIATPEM
jgi:WD40 repeat protein